MLLNYDSCTHKSVQLDLLIEAYATIIGSDNGLSPDWRQTITWTTEMILLMGPLGSNFSAKLIEIHIILFKKMHFKMSSGKCRPICLWVKPNHAFVCESRDLSGALHFDLNRLYLYIFMCTCLCIWLLSALANDLLSGWVLPSKHDRNGP